MRRLIGFLLLSYVSAFLSADPAFSQDKAARIVLPKPKYQGTISVEEAIYKRRSVRKFSAEPLTLEQVSQLLWAAGGATVDGITGPTRAYPSAGATYPLNIYLVAGSVTGLEPGVYQYEWDRNSLILLKKGDARLDLMKAGLSQRMLNEAPATIVVTAVYAKAFRTYGQRGVSRYVSMDTGHAGQNVHLEAESLGLGTVMVGAFIDREVQKVLGIKDDIPLYMMPVGKPGR